MSLAILSWDSIDLNNSASLLTAGVHLSVVLDISITSVCRSVVSLDWVRAGAELTVHYLMDMETAPDWYMEAWARHGHAS